MIDESVIFLRSIFAEQFGRRFPSLGPIMTYFDGELPDEAFTESERAAGVPNILRHHSGRRYWRSGKHGIVTENDCIALIIRSLIMQDLSTFSFEILSPDDDLGLEWDFWNLSGLGFADRTNFSILVHDCRIPIKMLMSALQKSGIPLFLQSIPCQWLGWDSSSQSLKTNLQYQGGHLKRCFFPSGSEREIAVPTDPDKARVFKLLRTAYLSSDFGKRPLLVHNIHLEDALAKKTVPFAEPSAISVEDFEHFSLVYFRASGEVVSIPLSTACVEKVTLATRTGSYFGYDGWRPFNPSLNEKTLWANGFRMSVESNSQKFRYYLRRDRGTVFQNTFERVDVPSSLKLWDSRVDRVAERSALLTQWACEREATMYLTVDCHPVEHNDCDWVTTPKYFSHAVQKLDELGFKIRNDLDKPDIICTSANKFARSKEGPFAQPWQPVNTVNRESSPGGFSGL
jgi:hypothetical protein